jgi:hypothetical protein
MQFSIMCKGLPEALVHDTHIQILFRILQVIVLPAFSVVDEAFIFFL